MTLGSKIREMRLMQGISLTELAKKTNLSQSFISQIERDLNNPSISSLRDICAVLKIPMFQLFVEGGDTGEILVRKDKRRIVTFPGNLKYEILTPTLNKAIGVMQIELKPGMSTESLPHEQEGEECVLVLEGEIAVKINQDEYQLNAGDLLYYSSIWQHLFINKSAEVARVLVVAAPPNI